MWNYLSESSGRSESISWNKDYRGERNYQSRSETVNQGHTEAIGYSNSKSRQEIVQHTDWARFEAH